MSNQDLLVSSEDWAVYLDKETGKVVCSFNNEMAESNLSDCDGMIGFYTDCKEFFDVRAGCQADIRTDEREKIKEHIDALGHKDVAGEIEDMGK